MEEQPTRSSETPSAANMKPNGITTVRNWPDGCGSPHSNQSHPVSTSPDQRVEGYERDGVLNGLKGLEELVSCDVGFGNCEGSDGNSLGNWGLGIKRPMKSKTYPPPKRRGIYAIRTFPPGCGLNMGLLRDRRIEVERNNQENQLEKNEVSNATVLPDRKDEKWENEDVKPIGGNGEVVSHELDEAILDNNGKFEGEGLSKEKKMKEKKNKKEHMENSEMEESKSDEFVISDEEEEVEEIERPLQMKCEQSKEIVLFNESNQETYKTEELKEKKKKKVVAKKNNLSSKKKSNEKSKEKIDNPNAATPLAIIPFEEEKSEDNIAEYYDSDYNSAIPRISESPKYPVHKPAKKSISGLSKPIKKSKPKGTKKNTKATIEERNSKAPTRFKGLSYELNLPPMNNKATDPRGKVRRILCIFQTLCRKKLQDEESKQEKNESEPKSKSDPNKKKDKFRIDLKAAEDLKNSCEYTEPGKPVVGTVPGIEVGDEFRYRMELHLVGLHRPLQCGIDWTELPDGVRVATSIVSSGGYSDKFNDSGVLIYTGSGGKPSKKRKQSQAEDQKLEKGNLALKNSMDLKMPVRVIHGSSNGERNKVMTFTYDGLYLVESYEYVDEVYKEYCTKVFKFKLRRIPGQPELGLHMAAKTKEARVREGLCVADISEGKEKMPICAINTIDDEKPPKFKYITSIIYPSWYERMLPKGCDCNGKCSNMKNYKRCACALRNEGNLPFNSQRLIVETKDLVYECGPTCKCPSSCPNRVSQNGISIPLEIFKTESRGWGVRSLSSISSGSFICEYVGEMLEDEEAEKLEKEDEYLFDIGKNYDDAPDTESGAGEEEEGFTIDAGKMGNVGRFINHSCSPNLYAQNVLFDHGDKRMPHVMFFATKNIPPLQELTYYYNYRIGAVRDKYGNEKRKDCYCGSVECEGRLY